MKKLSNTEAELLIKKALLIKKECTSGIPREMTDFRKKEEQIFLGIEKKENIKLRSFQNLLQ